MSYLRTVGKTWAAAWEAAAGSGRSAGANCTDGSRVPWPGEEGLAWDWDEELWPPLVFSMSPNLMEEGFACTNGCRKGNRVLAGESFTGKREMRRLIFAGGWGGEGCSIYRV